MTRYRRVGSRLEGHPTPVLPWVDVATGSLGQGLPDAVGVALAKYLDELPYRVWVLCGDSEMAEGSIWEALDKASYYKLANLIAIIDINRLGQRGPTELSWDLDSYAARAAAFGARVFVIDGHDMAAIDQALAEAGDLSGHRRPSSWPAPARAGVFPRSRTAKAGTASPCQNIWRNGRWSNSAANGTCWSVARARPRRPRPGLPPTLPRSAAGYERGQKVATRKAYGDALAALGVRPNVVAMDGEVSNSTFADKFAKAYPERYFEMFIAEQQLIAAAVGVGARGYRPFASTFAAFFTRAYDFIRMAAISRASICLAGSHAGWRSAPTARPRWRWRTWPCCAPCKAPPSCTPATRPRRRPGPGHGRPGGHLIHADHPGRLPGAVRRRGDLPGRRLQGAAPDR